MQPLDWMIVLACVTAAAGGFRLGFVARVTSWMGMAVGFAVGVAVLPYILRNAGGMSSTGRLGIVVLIMLVGLLLGQMLGLFAGSRLAASLPAGPLRSVDRSVGGVFGIVGVLVMLWLVLPTAANVPGWSAQQVRSSKVAQTLYSEAPRPPDAMQTLRRLVGSSSFPNVFDNIQPSLDTGPPPQTVTLSADVLTRARSATVKVEGIACRRTQDGSGFAIAPGLIATNAHVVAGEKRTTVFDSTGEAHSGTVVLYDSARDLALVRVPGFDRQALPLAEAVVGEEGAVFGHPGGQDTIAITPAAVRREITAVGRDLYDQQTTRRQVLILASQLAQGDSGGALVNNKGQVIGVAFAIAPDKPGTSYALSVEELRAVLAQPHDSPVSTNGCVND